MNLIQRAVNAIREKTGNPLPKVHAVVHPSLLDDAETLALLKAENTAGLSVLVQADLYGPAVPLGEWLKRRGDAA